MLGTQALGDVLDLRHRDGVGGQLAGVRVGGHDVAQVAPRTELAGGAMVSTLQKGSATFVWSSRV